MVNHEKLHQLPLWAKEVLDAVEVSVDPVDERDLQCQPAQQKGQLAYIQLPLPGCEAGQTTHEA